MDFTDHTTPTAAPPWRGFHHVALVTPNLDGTIEFYTRVLGMQASEVFPQPIEAAGIALSSLVRPMLLGLHFFEKSDAQLFPYPEGIQRFAFVPGALQHLAFALSSVADALALRERLTIFGTETTEIGNLGPIQNMLFRDNNGILLEATWPKA